MGLNIKKCRVQTYDGAGNMAGKQQGAANQLKLKTGNENATYFHCASNELNFTLSKSSKVPDIYNMNRNSRDASKATSRKNNLT